MKSILSYILTPFFLIALVLILLIFHPIQMICLNLGGYQAHKRSVEIMNILIIRSLHILGSKIVFEGIEKLPLNRPLIVISNHQSALDIPPIVWIFRHNHPKFISKKELGNGLPSISYNLRHGGSVLIDRKDRKQSLNEIARLGKIIEKNNYSAILFPEGTRTRDGRMKKFKTGGLQVLLSTAPSALIVPFAIHSNYELMKYGFYPMGIGLKLKYSVLAPIERQNRNAGQVMEIVESQIRKSIGQLP